MCHYLVRCVAPARDSCTLFWIYLFASVCRPSLLFSALILFGGRMTKQTLKMSGKPSPATGDEAVTVRRQISLFQAVNICVGFMIGSGIFVSPYGVLMHVRSVGLALVLWTITGLFNLVGALCYAELGTTFPRSGGDYVYIRAGLGRFPAFLCMWLCITVLMPVGVAACALIFAAYVLKPIYPDCEPPDEANGLVAMALIREFFIFIDILLCL